MSTPETAREDVLQGEWSARGDVGVAHAGEVEAGVALLPVG